MDSFIAYSLIGSALDEVLADPRLLKHAADDPDAELLDYLEKNGAELKAEVDRYCHAWVTGFRQKLAEAGLKKEALFGLEQTNPKLNTALEVARLGGYFVPGVGTAIMGAEALGNFGDMLAGGKSWGQRLGAGAAGLMNTGLAGLSLIPGGGFVGAALKSPRLLKMLKLFGPKAAPAVSAAGSKLLGWSQAPIKSMLGAAESGQGLMGRGMRLAGFNPAYKPWFGGRNPFQMLRAVSADMTAARRPDLVARLKEPARARAGMTTYIGAGMPGGRRMLAALPVQMAAGSIAAGPARISQPLPWGPGHPQYEQALRQAMS
jgi:hypothetical protein